MARVEAFKFEGVHELYQLFEHMPTNLARLTVKALSTRGAKIITDEAKKLPDEKEKTGNLKRSIGVIPAKRGKNYIRIGPRIARKGSKREKKKHLYSGFHAGWFAHGTQFTKRAGYGNWIHEAAAKKQKEVEQKIYEVSEKIITTRVNKYLKK